MNAKQNGYSDQQQATPIYLQSFDPETLRRVNENFIVIFRWYS